MVALTGMGILMISGALRTDDMLTIFSNPAPITIACLFVISAALDKTGIIDIMGEYFLDIAKKNKGYGISLLILVVFLISAFMNNTPVIIIMTPVVIKIAEKLKDSPSKYLIPLSYAGIMGGSCTIIGTSTNILVDGMAQKYGQPAFSMFEISGPGILMAITGMTYLSLFGRLLLPNRTPPKDLDHSLDQQKKFIVEATIPAHSQIIGKTLSEITFTEDEDYEIMDLVRKEYGSRLGLFDALRILMPKLLLTKKEGFVPFSTLRDIPLQVRDRIIFKVKRDEFLELRKNIGVTFNVERENLSELLPTSSFIVSEGVIADHSGLVGTSIRSLPLSRRYGCYVIGLHRKGKDITGDLGNTQLYSGDTVILEGPEDEMTKLFENEDIVNASQVRHRKIDKIRAPIVLFTLSAIVGLAGIGVMPIAGLAFLGALGVILTGCISAENAYKAIEWRILLLIFGMLGIGMAMENTGAMELLIKTFVNFVKPFGPVFILALVYFLTSFLTEVITNNAVAIVMTPIVINLALNLGYDPRPFAVAVMFAASASFATPIGYQTNTFVYAAGGYTFTDFLKIGVPLNILMFLISIAVIPVFWPF